MKLKFSMEIRGEKSLQDKFEAAIEDNPKIHINFMSAFIRVISAQLRLHDKDNVTITNFRVEQNDDD